MASTRAQRAAVRAILAMLRPKPPAAGSRLLLFCPGVATVLLPWWPEEVERSNLGRTWEEITRTGRQPLLLSSGKNLQEYNLGFTLRSADMGESMADNVAAIEAMANSQVPISLVMASTVRGLFHITSLSVVETEHNGLGHPSVVDVSMTLKEASDAVVIVGPVARKRNKKPNKDKTPRKGRKR